MCKKVLTKGNKCGIINKLSQTSETRGSERKPEGAKRKEIVKNKFTKTYKK